MEHTYFSSDGHSGKRKIYAGNSKAYTNVLFVYFANIAEVTSIY
jgi:hypothetical protein